MNPLITSGKNLPSGKDLPSGLGPSKRTQSVKEPMIQGSSKTSRERELEESKQKSIVSVKEEIKQLRNESEIQREKVELTYGPQTLTQSFDTIVYELWLEEIQ